MQDATRLQVVAEIRMKALATIRLFFTERGFTEIEAPLLVSSPDSDPSLSPLEVSLRTSGRQALITSPEYSMKKLLGGGMTKIFFLGKVFRDEEVWDETHTSEFTLLEWYETGMDYRAGMDQTMELIEQVASALGVKEHPLLSPWEMVRVEEAFARDLHIERIGERTKDELFALCQDRQIHTTNDDTWSDLFYRLYLTAIEPRLPSNKATVLYDYPLPQSALARPCVDGIYAERFELFSGQLELCNAFTELTDVVTQRARFEAERKERARLGKPVFPIDEELLRLLPSVPNPTFGNALGVDRLLMTLLGADSIEDLLLFPPSRLIETPSAFSSF